MKIISTFTLLFLINISIAQDIPKWYTMESVKDIEGTWCAYSTKVITEKDILHTKDNYNFIRNKTYSRFDISGVDQKVPNDYRSEINGIRGNIDGNEVLVIDSNLDFSFEDESIIVLPQQELETTIDYNELYQYPTNENYNYLITYDNLRNNHIYQKTSNIGIKVFTKYDSLNNTLRYLNKFKVCYNDKLVYNGILDNTKIKIETFDYFPWTSSVKFKLNSIDFKSNTVPLKSQFKVRENGQTFRIDSVDLINNKFLLSVIIQKDKFNIHGESIFDESIISSENKKSEFQLYHFWGSWCLPCVKNFPKIKTIQASYPELGITGVCYDKNKIKPQKVVLKYKLDWDHMYFDLNKGEARVNSFPIYILVKNDEVVGRFSEVEELDEYLVEHLK